MIFAGNSSVADRSDDAYDKDRSCTTNIVHTTLPIAITFCHRRGRAIIYKSVVTALGNPDYIRMLINPAEKILAAQVCDLHERDAIAVPRNLRKDGVSFVINSVALLESMTKLMNWSKQLTYRIKGELQLEFDSVIFQLNNAQIVNDTDESEMNVS